MIYDSLDDGAVGVGEMNGGFVVAYSVGDSIWTILDPVLSREINSDAIRRLTKKTRTQAVVARFCSNTGTFGYWHLLNGKLVEEFYNLDPDFDELSPEEGRRVG